MLNSIPRRVSGLVRRQISSALETHRTIHASAVTSSAATECKINSRTRTPASEGQIPQPQRLATRMLINGEFVSRSSDGGIFSSIAPANGKIIKGAEELPQASVKDVDAAVQAAHQAFHVKGPGTWSSLSPRARGALLYRLSELIAQHKEELAVLEALDNGKTLAQARMVDAPACASMFKYWAGWSDKLENGRVIDIGGQHFNYTLHQPIGVCALIVPWNLPLIAAAAKMGPALTAGNTVILKPAEQTPLSTLRLAELVVEAGFPKGVVNIIPGDGTTGAALVSHPLVNKISFTGSTPVGLRVGQEAAKTCKRVSLELGGKNPVIVCADANLEQAVESVHNGLFWNEGEACASGSRIFIHENIYDKFVSLSVQRAKKRKVGHSFATEDGVAQGSQVSQEQMDKILGYISSAEKEGARLELGGYRMGKEGFYIAPTVFSNVEDRMTVAKEEIFGPVMCLQKFRDEDEVLQRANSTPFGLAAGIFTQSTSIGQRLTRGIHAGIVFWNCYHVVDVSAPFGGMKQSGQGREGGGSYGLEPYMEVKNIVQNIA
jgi:aldehyde dehydrogenase (NAD+)